MKKSPGDDTQRRLLRALRSFKRGDFSVRLPVGDPEINADVAAMFNDIVELNERMAKEFSRVSGAVGDEGKIHQRAAVAGAAGSWATLVASYNSVINDLIWPINEVARVITAVAKGDLDETMALSVDKRPIRGEFLRIGKTINVMVGQLRSFASEVTRVAHEVGTDGKLGGQAYVKGIDGTWKDLTDNVNLMAANLTGQVRNIAEVTTAVAKGDLTKKIAVDVKGEILALKNTVNTMVDQLGAFAFEVTRVAREVGTEGKLGAQADVRGVGGIWHDLTKNVNRLAANLTTQVRAISEVATAVTKGDLSRSITVNAHGEVAALKAVINEMIRNLRETTLKNTEQDWLKTNLAKFTRLLQGQRNIHAVSDLILAELAPVVDAQHGVFYMAELTPDGVKILTLAGGYAHGAEEGVHTQFHLGEGLVGQCAVSGTRILVSDVPGPYIRISSGLGEHAPLTIVVVPISFEGEVKAVIELASVHRFSEVNLAFLDQLAESLGVILNTMAANMRTEDLLMQSQALNEELEEKASLLAAQNSDIERKNMELELARRALEDKASQLSRTSKYKSEFLANMSHELRTPLNSLLILARQLADNSGGNLTAKQVEFSKTIYSAGIDLLSLINDILDLSKVEAGMMTVELGDLPVSDVRAFVERTFRQTALDKGIDFSIEIADDLPANIFTDVKRLQQILKNLLSNALKFTEKGSVSLSVSRSGGGMITFEVSDTGIGIAKEKQTIIFEPFQQADGSTSRKYGGTGLGLSISRDMAELLGGDIVVASTPDQGSVFILHLPERYTVPRPRVRAIHGISVPFLGPSRVAEKSRLLIPSADVAQDYRALEGKRILIVDDDVLNIFAITSFLERYKMSISFAENGIDGLEMLEGHPGIDIVLLDIMMPEMDGYEMVRRVRAIDRFRDLPVIVVTAKAMKGDREICIDAGASDYITKPIDTDRLLAVLLGSL